MIYENESLKNEENYEDVLLINDGKKDWANRLMDNDLSFIIIEED